MLVLDTLIIGTSYLTATLLLSKPITMYMRYRARYYRERVSNFDQSEAGKHCFVASDWLKFETLPRKYCTSGVLSNCVQVEVVLYHVCIVMYLIVYFYTTIQT